MSEPSSEGASLVRIDYTNWRGERGWRTVAPVSMAFASVDYHGPGRQWFLLATDVEKGVSRYFAMLGIHAWEPAGSPS